MLLLILPAPAQNTCKLIIVSVRFAKRCKLLPELTNDMPQHKKKMYKWRFHFFGFFADSICIWDNQSWTASACRLFANLLIRKQKQSDSRRIWINFMKFYLPKREREMERLAEICEYACCKGGWVYLELLSGRWDGVFVMNMPTMLFCSLLLLLLSPFLCVRHCAAWQTWQLTRGLSQQRLKKFKILLGTQKVWLIWVDAAVRPCPGFDPLIDLPSYVIPILFFFLHLD